MITSAQPDETFDYQRICMRVLLIEDDSATAQSIELMLKSENFNVYATGGRHRSRQDL
jgi:hypothetical protein